jgi:hypothetical protein
MVLTLFLKIRTGQAGRQLLEKILFNLVGAMGLGNEPAFHGWLSMGRAEHLGARQRFPAGLLFRAAVVKGDSE